MSERRVAVFIDTAVANYQSLLAQPAGVDHILLAPSADGFSAMAAFLAAQRDYDAIAIVGHGAAGQVVLGAATLDAQTLSAHEAQLATLGSALNPDGELLLYGCNVADGVEGSAFVRELATRIGASVAAATHPVGSPVWGGSWDLDYRTGAIVTPLPFSSALFSGVLDATVTLFALDDQQHTEGDTVALTVTAGSSANLPLTFGVSGLPGGLSIQSVNDTSALISGTIAPGAAAEGPYLPTITASDGSVSDVMTIYWEVEPNPPTVTVGDSMTVSPGATVTLSANATAPAGIANIMWQVSADGADFETIDGFAELTVQHVFPHYGEYDVLVTVTDTFGYSGQASFHVTAEEIEPTASSVTGSGPIQQGETETFTVALVGTDTIDTITLNADWYGSGIFSDVTAEDNGGTLTFSHVYTKAGTYTAVVRLSNDAGEETDYPINVVVAPVAPVANLTTTGVAPWPSTWLMKAGDTLQFTGVTAADPEALEYHFIVDGVDNVIDEPAFSLPDYSAGRRYTVQGYVKDRDNELQSSTESFNVLVGGLDQGLWGTLGAAGSSTPANAGGNSINLGSNTATTLQVTIDPDSLAAWPVNWPVDVVWFARIYDISPTLGGLGEPLHDLIDTYSSLESYDSVHTLDDWLTVNLPGFEDYREIHVTARLMWGTHTVGTAPTTPNELGSQFAATWVSPEYSLTFKTNQPPTLLQQLANGLELVKQLAAQFAEHANDIIQAITTDPGTFLDNMLTGLGNAARQLASDLTDPARLRSRLFQWLVGTTNLSALSNLDFTNLDNVKNFLLQYSGLTWDHLQQVLQQQLGAGNYAAATKIADLISSIDPSQGGDPTQLFAWLQNLPSNLGAEFSDALAGFDWPTLADELVSKATTQLTTALQQMAPRLLAKFVPGVGVAQSLYQGLTFVLNNQNQIADFFQAFKNSLDDLFASLTEPERVADYANSLVAALEGPGLNAVLNFAMAQLGLANLPQDVQRAVRFIPNRVDTAMRRMVAAVASKLRGLPGSAGNSMFTGQLAAPLTFTHNSQSYTLWVAKDRTGPKVKLASGSTFLGVLTATSFDIAISPDARTHLQALVAAGSAMTSAATARAMANQQTAVTAAAEVLKADILNNSCILLNAGCFAAGTQLWTPDGYRNVEDLQPGDLVWARDEFNADGPIAAKPVEARFVRTGRILHLHLASGGIVRTTAEHPFYVEAAGWTAAGSLQAGDRIRAAHGWTLVADVYDTGTYEAVYNIRVADWHTYFVLSDEGGPPIWAHNAYTLVQANATGSIFQFTGNSYSAQWFIPKAFLTPEGKPRAAVVTAINRDIQSGLGNALQIQVSQAASTWSTLAWNSNEKVNDGRRARIEQSLDVANEILQQLGMDTVSYEAFIQGASLPLIPSTKPSTLAMSDSEYAALKTAHGDALATAYRQRAAAKGDYIHYRLKTFAEANGHQYFGQGLDVLAAGLRFEAMVTGAWSDHSGASFQLSFWRALQY